MPPDSPSPLRSCERVLIVDDDVDTLVTMRELLELEGARVETATSCEQADLVLGSGFIGSFAWYAVQMTWQSWAFNDMAQGVVAVPMWIPQLGYSGGLVILFIAFVDELIHVLRGNAPRYELPKPQSAEEVVERAMQSGV